jgi:hypothetical protein
MAIGDTVQAGLMRIDSSPILLAGQAQAKANQAFGDAIGGVVEKFYQKKKEKQEREQRERAYRKMGFSAEEAKAASGDKDLANQFMNKMVADRNYQLRLNDFAMRQEAFKSQQDMLNEQKALNESLAKFSMQPVKTPTPEFSALQQEYRPEQIPGTPEFIAMQEEPIPERPSIIAKYITEKPDFKRFEKQDSPAVAQLPDSFKPQGRMIQDAVESGELSNQAGIEAINNLVGPGLSPSDKLAREKFDYEKAKDAEEAKPKPPQAPIYMEAAIEAIDDSLKFVEEDSIINPTVGFGSETMANIGGTDAANLQAALSTVTSAIGFKRLQDMREASPTGGALGAVSERELSQLNAALGSISQKQGKPQLKKNLERIKKHYQNSVKAINAQRMAYQQGKTFKSEQEALDFINQQSQGPGIDTKQGTYRIPGLSVEAQ